MVYIGIDPGKNGGIAWIKDNGKASAERLNIETLASRLRVITANGSRPTVCYLEKVHSMPKQGVSSTFSFGMNYGIIIGHLMALGVNFELVTPPVWKKAMEVTADKRTSIKRCRELFPDVDLKATARSKKDHDGMAEALLIAEYGRRSFENSKH